MPEGILLCFLNIIIAGSNCCKKCCIVEVRTKAPMQEVDREVHERHIHVQQITRTIDIDLSKDDVMPPLDLNGEL